MARLIGVSVLVIWALAVGVGGPRDPAVAATQRCFPETGHCIEGRFLEYWEQNGGLPVFGVPLTAAQEQVNADTGKSYLTQWFERSRFELHRENARPYDVLLGRLGADQLRLGIAPDQSAKPPPQIPNKDYNCLWFPETRINLCDKVQEVAWQVHVGFRSYWESHGLSEGSMNSYQRSLALLGMPITDPFYAYNSSGDKVLMQYFERARLEYPLPLFPRRTDLPVRQGRLGAETHTPITRWQTVRSVVPASIPVYQPGWLPERYNGPRILSLVWEGEGRDGCEAACYTLTYQGQYQEDLLGLILNDGYQGLDNRLPRGELVSTEAITVTGSPGTLYTGVADEGSTRYTSFTVTWVQAGQDYLIAADRTSLTRSELLRILENLMLVE